MRIILFTKPSDEKILDGTKTMTARLWKQKPPLVGEVVCAQTGRKTETSFAYLKVLDVREWNGHQISSGWYQEKGSHPELAWKVAKKEGFDSALDFLQTYRKLNQHNLADETRNHYFIEFRLAEDNEVFENGDSVVCLKCRCCRTFTNNGKHRDFSGAVCDGRDFELR